MNHWRNRVVGLERHKPGDLAEHPAQWRVHPGEQRAALRAVLDEVGIAGALLAFYDSNGQLTAIDGHLRRSLNPDVEWPVLVLDVNEEESLLLLATHDPLAEMAQADAKALDGLMARLKTENEALAGLFHDVAEQANLPLAGEAETPFADFGELPPAPDYVSFRIGNFSGRVSKPVYQSFVAAYRRRRRVSGQPAMDDVLKDWLDV